MWMLLSMVLLIAWTLLFVIAISVGVAAVRSWMRHRRSAHSHA